MGLGFKETSINKMDKKKYDENFAQIKWDTEQENEDGKESNEEDSETTEEFPTENR